MKKITFNLTAIACLFGSVAFGQMSQKPANYIPTQNTNSKADLIGCIEFTDSGQNLDQGQTSGRMGILDFDNDGDMDFISTGHSKDSLVIWKNDGTGIMSKDTAFYMNQAFSVGIADFNGDGTLDIAFGAEDTSEGIDIYFYLNGKYTFSANIAIGYGYSISSGDLDGDNDQDLIISGYSNGVTILLNDGTGTFTATPNTDMNSTYAFVSTLGDIDNDQDLDLIVGGYSAGIKVYENDGTGLLTLLNTYTGADIWGVDVADLNADGFLDIYYGERNGQHHVLIGDGAFSFTDNGAFGNDMMGDVKLADIEGDGDLDALVSGISWGPGYNEVYLNDGNGVFTNSGASFGLGGYGLDYADFNNDGINDFLAGSFDSGTGTKIYYGNTLTIAASTVANACNGVDNGEIIINALGGTPPFEYSLDGTNYQTGNTFTGLAPAIYTYYTREQNNTSCEVIKTIEIINEACVSVDEDEVNTTSIYPNPIKDKLHIEVSGSEFSIEIYSIIGELVYVSQNNSTSKTINVTDFDKGMYQVLIKQKNTLTSYKIVK